MELPGSAYLYTLATLAMTFAGFCAIVIVLRQTTGNIGLPHCSDPNLSGVRALFSGEPAEFRKRSASGGTSSSASEVKKENWWFGNGLARHVL
jgi:hypothetical protein